MTQAFGPGLLDEWLIEKDLTFLNHGSYGAVPRVVLSAQNHWRDQLERQPVRFFNETLASALSDAAQSLAGFVGAPPASLVFVTNATEGINAVLRSLRLGSGDEILTTDQAYQGVLNSLHYECARSGAALKTVSLPCPTVDESQIVNAVKSSLGPRATCSVGSRNLAWCNCDADQAIGGYVRRTWDTSSRRWCSRAWYGCSRY